MAEELEHKDSKRSQADNRKSVMLKALRSRLSTDVHDKLEHEDVLMAKLVPMTAELQPAEVQD